jgi:cytochrome P450
MSAVNLMDPEFTNNPMRAYGRLREQAPVVPVLFPGVPTPIWLITRYDEVKAALMDERFVLDRNNVPGIDEPSAMDHMMDALGIPEEFRQYLKGMLTKDGKSHNRLRRLVAPAFTARRIQSLRPHVEHIAEQVAKQLKEKDGADLIEDFSNPFAGTIICELVGVDEADRPEMRKWIQNYANADPTRILESANYLIAYTKDLIERRRAAPADDLVSKLITHEDEGDRLTDAEIITMVLLLIHTGHHTTASFVPSAALALLDHPDQVKLLRAEPGLLPQAVTELLRTASPVTIGTLMYAVEDLDLAGTSIKRGDPLIACLVSANHDPRAFDDPERLDIRRTPIPNRQHVAFYHGPHFCLGASLAMLESEIALDQLFLKHDGLSLAIERDQIQYHPHPSGSLLARMPVHF